MLTKANHRATRPPRARDLFGGEAEAALRSWLAFQLPLSDRRIVEYYEHRGRSARLKYRELDAIAIDNARSLQVFEIKASQSATSLRRANRQLQETRTILRPLFPEIRLTILLVDTGIPTAEDVAALTADEDASPIAPPTLADMLEALPQIQLVGSLAERSSDPASVSLLRFSVGDIVALVGADGLHLDWADDDLL